MHLVLFDIDGTLTRGTRGDTLFEQVVTRRLGIDRIDTDWGSYPHATDSSICRALLERHNGGATPGDVAGIHDEYVATIEAHLGQREPIAGAAGALAHLEARGFAIAYATGNWNAAGLAKLRAAGLPADRFPLAGATNIESREAIMQDGVDRAAAHHGVAAFERVVYIGDASWDVQAARNAQMPLVGIADPVERLRAQGVSHVLPDYRDLEAFLDAVRGATVPR